MALDKNIIVKMIDQTKQATQGIRSNLDSISQKAKEVGGNVTGMGKTLTAGVTLPIVGIGVASLKTAADLQDAFGATDQIFKSQAESMKTWADELQSFYGISEGEALQYANTMGAMLQNIGGRSEEEASDMSQNLVMLAGDLSAMFGGSTADAIRALTGSLKGNNTMLDNYGMAVNDAMIKTKALEMGLIKEGEALDLASKQAATLELIMEQSADAQGQAGREAEGASGSLKSLATDMKNLASDIGEVLIPVVIPLVQNVRDLIGRFATLDESQKKTIIVVGALAAVLGPLLIVVGSLITAFGTVAGVIGAVASPVMLVVVAVGLLVAGVILLMQKLGLLQPIVDYVKALFQTLKNTWDNVREAFSRPEVQEMMQKLRDAVDRLKEAFEPLIQKIKQMIAPLQKHSEEGGAFVSTDTIVKMITFSIEGMIKVIEFMIPIIEWVIEVIIRWIEWNQQLAQKIRDIIQAVIELYQNIKAQVQAFIAAGKAIGEGFLNGLKESFVAVKRWVDSTVSSIKKKFRDALKIKSPSKVFEEYGNFVGQGFEIGLNKSFGNIDAGAFGKQSAQSFITNTNNRTLSVNVSGNNFGGNNAPNDLVQAIRDELARENRLSNFNLGI